MVGVDPVHFDGWLAETALLFTSARQRAASGRRRL